MKTAQEAAVWVNEHPETSVDRVQAVIPEYQNGLHRRQWIANFFKFLSDDLHPNFLELKQKPKS